MSERLTMEKIEPIFKPRVTAQYCPSTYVFDAYCKYENPAHTWQEFPVTPYGVETYGEAVRSLRKDGWIIHRDGTATCPKCRAALREQKDASQEARDA